MSNKNDSKGNLPILIGAVLVVIQLFISCISPTTPNIGEMDWGPEMTSFNFMYLLGYNFLIIIGIILIIIGYIIKKKK